MFPVPASFRSTCERYHALRDRHGEVMQAAAAAEGQDRARVTGAGVGGARLADAQYRERGRNRESTNKTALHKVYGTLLTLYI